MRITDISNISKTARIGKKKSGGDQASFLSEATGDNETSSSAGVASSAPVNTFFALQEVGDEHSPKQQALQYGYDILEQLEAVRLGLLNGAINMDTLHRIDRSIAGWKNVYHSPELSNIIADIELRAKVERAKLEAASL
jgi:hypothetical protein